MSIDLERPGNVLVATDFGAAANDAVARAAWLPLAPGATITLVHVSPELPPVLADEERAGAAVLETAAERVRSERLRARLPAVVVHTAIDIGSPAERVAVRARETNAALVVVGRGKREGFTARLLGTTAERITRACGCSVLVVANAPENEYARPLVSVDLSSLSRRALMQAWAVTGAPAMSVMLVHTLPSLATSRIPISSELVRGSAAEDQARARRQLDAWTAENADLGIELRPRVRHGDIARMILAEAETERSDLLVVGARGHSTLLHLALGSTTERLLRRADRDVLVVRAA